MGRRLNIPIPTVIDTELVPLDEMFSIDNDSTLEQWYYDNNSKYAPNRKFTPLILTPKISVYDKDSERSWSSDTSTGVDKLSIYLVEWYVKEYDATAQDYVERKITTGDASGDYVIHEQQLYVRKNVSYSHAVTIRCVVTYIDPRDPGLTYSVEDKLMLTTNRDSTVVFPEVAIISPSTRTYNPLIDDTNSRYTFDGEVINNPETQEVTELRKYTANVYGTEEVLPSTEEDPTSCAPIMDIRYGAGEVRQNEEFMYRQTANGDFPVMENNAYIDAIYGNTVAWNGSLRSVKMSKIKTTGFNQWDEEWEVGYIDPQTGANYYAKTNIRSKNYIPVIPSTNYFIRITGNHYVSVCFYDANKTFVSGNSSFSSNNEIITPSNAAFMRFAPLSTYGNTYNNDICINISNTTKNGTYEPYEEHNVSLPVTTWKGRVGSDEPIVMFSDGLKRVSEALYDEIAFANGEKTATKRVGSIDIGRDLSWTYSDDTFTSSTISDIRFETLNAVCSRYAYYKSGATDKFFAISNNNIVVKDSSYTDATTFRASMAGVIVYYELATPITYDLVEPDEFVWYGTKDGQEVKADTLPWYVSGQETSQLTVDAMYGESITAILRVRMPGQEDLSPSKAYASIAWRTQDNIDTRVVSENGGAVRSDMQDMTFSTIVNTNKTVLSDDIKQKHLAFNWKYRKSNAATEYNAGWGQNITLDADVLRNVKGSSSQLSSTLVYPYVYLIGAYEEVTDGGEIVTDTSAKVFDRAIE